MQEQTEWKGDKVWERIEARRRKKVFEGEFVGEKKDKMFSVQGTRCRGRHGGEQRKGGWGDMPGCIHLHSDNGVSL